MTGNRKPMTRAWTLLLLAGALSAAAAVAAQEHEHARGGHPPVAGREHAPEPFHGPRGYRPVTPPPGWDRRPARIDRDHFNHNFRAHRRYGIGPYLPPPGWVERTWYVGELLPEAFFAPEYRLGDYWLFNLETPPVGCEWVRYGHDALLVDLATGRVEQAVHGLFF